MSTIYKFFYTALALSMTLFVYAVNNDYIIKEILDDCGCFETATWVNIYISPFWSYVVYLLLMALGAFALSFVSRYLPSISIEEGNVKTIEPAGEGMMLTYFGLFFFALSVHSVHALIISFVLLLACILFSNVYMYNPIFSLIFYRFYYITLPSGKKCLLISREKFESGDKVKFDKVYKLNEFTYID